MATALATPTRPDPLEAKLARLEGGRPCRVCREALTAREAATQCPACSAWQDCPPAHEWPPLLKTWCVVRLLERYFLAWLTPHDVWMRLLRAALGGEQAHPRRGDHMGPWDAGTMYQAGLARAQAWHEDGRPQPK